MLVACDYPGDISRTGDEDQAHMETRQEKEGSGVQEFLRLYLQQWEWRGRVWHNCAPPNVPESW